ncbi:MAG: T9SS type A sorting domain-containing protein [Phaeodactylibacter sp.]|nr:T9SS type A sorting domain-containing protein [Phaeodactylibacter sp.]
MNKTLLLIASVLFLSIRMMGQPLPCFHFEDIPAGTQIGPASGNSPGDVLFSQAGIQVSIQEILYPDGTTGFANAQILDDNTGWLDGQFFFMGNNSLRFDLSQADGALNQLCFDFFDGGGVENFAVNGSSVAVLDNFSEVASLSFPGVAVEVDFSNTNSPGQGTVCITGNIESLLIGGQEFGIDNVCADAVLACPIANLQAEIVSCDDNGDYNIEVDFDWLSPLTVIVNFDILIEGERAATITQADLPYLLEGVQPATDALEFTLAVCQSDNADCCESVILQKQCPAGGCMEFEGLAGPVYGNSAGTPPGTPFYNESDIGLLLIPFQSLFWTTTYGDLVVLDAAAAPEMTAASGQYLGFESVNAVFDLTGYPDPVDSVVVDFYYSGGAVNLAANGSNILIQNALLPGLYALAPGITLRVVFDNTSATEGQLIFAGNIQTLLIGGAGDFRIDNLCVNPVALPCRLAGMSIELGPCEDTIGFNATINFDYQGTSDSFSLFGPGVQGNYAYADLPVTVGPVPNNNSGIYAFFAADLAQDGCWLGDTIQAVPCTGCAFEGLTVNYLGLAPNGQNAIEIDFDLVGPTVTDFFSVYFDGQLYERFSWNDVPARLLVPCNSANDVVREITVCEGEDHCCVTLPLIYLAPCPAPCSIANLQLRPGPCNPNNVFDVTLDFDYRNTSDTFELWLNGNATGRFFAYADLPVSVSPFVAPTNDLEFTVVDANRPDCGATAVLPAYDCGNPCNGLIDSVAYYLTDCNDNGNYFIVIEQLFPNPPNLAFLFSVSVDGMFAGSFSSAGLPVELGPYPGNGTARGVAVYTQNTTDCAYRFITAPVQCDGACPLQSVGLAGDVQCDNSGFYRAKLRVEGPAVGDVLTVTSAVTNFSLTVAYDGGPVVVEMPDTGQNYDELTVCLPLSTTNTLCCLDIAFDYVCRPCDIFNFHLDPLDCTADTTFFFTIDFDAQGAFSDTFTLQLSNGFEQHFLYSQLPLTMGPIPGLGEQLDYWLTEMSGNCGASGSFITPDCIDGCVLGTVTTPIANVGCNNDGTYNIPLHVENAQPGDLLLVQSVVTGYTDTLAYGQLGALVLQLSHWPAPPNGREILNICFLNQQDCCVTAEFAVNCPCPWLTGVTIAPNGCRNDGTFTATLNITTPAPAIGNIFVVESENYRAEFSVADLPVEIGPFPGTGGPRTVHVLFPGTDCQTTVTFITPDCGNGGCAFTGIVAEPHSCDGGQFLIDVEVRAVNPGALGYFIFADGQINGPYAYNEPFVTLGPFDGDGTTIYDLLILDIEDPSCFGYAEVGPVDCGALCGIHNLRVDPLGCNADGTYNVLLNFEVDNPGNDFFDVYGRNGDLIGFYRLDERPVRIEGLDPVSSGVGYLRVCINDTPGCCEDIEFFEPDCTGACRIYDVRVEPDSCDADGNYYVRLYFNFDNISSNSNGFRVFGNGQDYGTYSYTMPFPVTVGPIAPTGALAYELIVADLGNPDCRGVVEFGAFDCSPDSLVCITFDEFETAPNDTVNLAFGSPLDSIYDEAGIVFNAVAVPLANNASYFEWVTGAAFAPCGTPAAGGNLYMNGGIEMDFSPLATLPTAITFDVYFCNSPSVIPQIALGANGELYSGLLSGLPADLPGGIRLEFIPAANSFGQGQVIVSGAVENLVIGGQWLFIDNLCFNQPGPQAGDDCVSFDAYDGVPGDTLANYGHPEELEYREDGVVVTARSIEWNGAANYFTGVYVFGNSFCGFGDDDAALEFGGALRFSFTGLPNLPVRVSFGLAFCQGQSQDIILSVNGENYRGDIAALPDMLSNVAVSASRLAGNSNIWQVELTGTVENFEIGGSGLSIDDVCFDTPMQDEEVWPGDANADNLAHHIDLLSIGLAYGFQGTPRFVDGANWMGVTAADWPRSFANGTNYKHADCNGDGVVDLADRQVLVQNYGLTHGPRTDMPDLPGTDTDPPGYIDFPATMPVGSAFNIPIIIGTRSQPIQDVYGIAFTVEFDPQIFDPNAFGISYPVSWFGEPGVNTLAIDRTYAADGRIEVAITRIDQNNVSGHGAVAYLIGIIDDIAGFQPASQVLIKDVLAISREEVRIPIQGRSTAFELQYKEEAPAPDAKGVFSVFPNPATDWVTVTSKYGYQPEQLTLLALDGREIRAPQEENRRISLKGLPAGTYILSIRTGGTRVHKLIVKD